MERLRLSIQTYGEGKSVPFLINQAQQTLDRIMNLIADNHELSIRPAPTRKENPPEATMPK
jgi:hypothetical protein